MQAPRCLGRGQASGSPRSATLNSTGVKLQRSSNAVLQRQRATRASASKGSEVTITFRLRKYKCEWGEVVALVGNRPELGNWDVNQALYMTWSDGHQWSRAITLAATENVAANDISYKYAILTVDDGCIRAVTWQEGKNFNVHVPSIEGRVYLHATDTWDNSHSCIEVTAEEEAKGSSLLWAEETSGSGSDSSSSSSSSHAAVDEAAPNTGPVGDTPSAPPALPHTATDVPQQLQQSHAEADDGDSDGDGPFMHTAVNLDLTVDDTEGELADPSGMPPQPLLPTAAKQQSVRVANKAQAAPPTPYSSFTNVAASAAAASKAQGVGAAAGKAQAQGQDAGAYHTKEQTLAAWAELDDVADDGAPDDETQAQPIPPSPKPPVPIGMSTDAGAPAAAAVAAAVAGATSAGVDSSNGNGTGANSTTGAASAPTAPAVPRPLPRPFDRPMRMAVPPEGAPGGGGAGAEGGTQAPTGWVKAPLLVRRPHGTHRAPYKERGGQLDSVTGLAPGTLVCSEGSE